MAVGDHTRLRVLDPQSAAAEQHAAELAGLDALELTGEGKTRFATRLWSAAWPKLGAIALALLIWQGFVWMDVKPEYALPSPFTVLDRLWGDLQEATLWRAVGITLVRAVRGFALALAIGVAIGVAVSRSKILRSAVGSLITGLQTMPSIAWFPAAILLFRLSEAAITFVIILGAAPSIANGLIHGIDHIPPILLRAGRVLGARGLSAYRHVIIPAALPDFVGGLKQGWAFAWRSLLAGELIVSIANRQSLGFLLQLNRELADAVGLYGVMIVILVVGVVIDALVFATVEKALRRRRGLLVS